MAPRALGFRHHGEQLVPKLSRTLFAHMNRNTDTEYWALSPHSPQQTRICVGADGEEDPEGSMKIPTTGINPPHLMVRVTHLPRDGYFGLMTFVVLWHLLHDAFPLLSPQLCNFYSLNCMYGERRD